MGRNQLRSLSPPIDRPKMATSKCFCGSPQHEENCFNTGVTRSGILFKANVFAAVDPFECEHWCHLQCLLDHKMKNGCPHGGCGSKKLTGIFSDSEVTEKVNHIHYYKLY